MISVFHCRGVYGNTNKARFEIISPIIKLQYRFMSHSVNLEFVNCPFYYHDTIRKRHICSACVFVYCDACGSKLEAMARYILT